MFHQALTLREKDAVGREGPAAWQVVVTIDCAHLAVEARSITYEGDEVAGGTRLLALAVRCWRL
jgi:hypothetical protein